MKEISFPRWMVPIVLFFCSIFYLGQNIWMPISSSDEAQQADYLRAILHGQWPFRDFIDIYGPIHWFLPAWIFRLAGEQWWGVRLGMVGLQLMILFLSYRLVRRYFSEFQAGMVWILQTIILGMPWNLHYTPYAFMSVYVLTLLIMGVFLRQKSIFGASPDLKNSLIAGSLTGITLLIKFNAGLFLMTAGLVVCGFMGSPLFSGTPNSPSAQINLRKNRKNPTCPSVFWSGPHQSHDFTSL